MTMAKTKRTPHQPLISTNPRGLAARVTATRPSPCCFQPPRAHHPPAYLTQDQRGEHSMSLISTVAAAKAKDIDDDPSASMGSGSSLSSSDEVVT
jgi:hypothetical protein